MKAIFSCLYLKPDDGFLLYNMPEVFNKTGHGLTNIIIALDEFSPVLHPEEETGGLPPWLRPVSKNFLRA